ncbi:MAG: ABC transporter permease [Actinobacteria bacterium]|nr:ABC transporter permease [Actinomycetota bacterium]
MTGVLAQARPLLEWDWVGRNGELLWELTRQHLYFTGMAVGIGLAISLALSVVALRWRATLTPILGFGSVLYTIPSLALFALLLPVLGIGDALAITALVTYTILILVRNIVAGIDGVPREVIEAADGMGYRPARRFLEIELPLAMPVVVAGLRIASVTVIGLVTVTALIGRGGLGALILRGFRTLPPFPTMIVVGTLLSVVLAITVDLLLLGVERALTPWARRKTAP